jgi:lipopolysaccharide export system protein LptA
MKIIILLIFFPLTCLAREIGQTEITTDSGIEVFQNEKYYLLKDNVKIISDNFKLEADQVKVFFDKDLYDITNIISKGRVIFTSKTGGVAKSEKLNFSPKNQIMKLEGVNSYINLNNLELISNKLIIINDLNGSFKLEGKLSKLKNDNLIIKGNNINGFYETINEINEIINIEVIDDKISNIVDNGINMYAKKATYDKKNNIIELFDKVKIIRDKEVAVGDYAQINTLTKAYKIHSKGSNKVKILLDQSNE